MEDACRHYRAILEREPQNVEARYSLATALMDAGDYEAARAELERLARLAPDLPQVHYSLGYTQRQLGAIAQALASYRRVLELRPNHADTWSNLLLTLNYSADCSTAQIFAEHVRFGERHAEPASAPAPDTEWPRRLRVGYVSPDFYSHVVSCFLWPILARHDRSRFEVFCYHTHHTRDEVTVALRSLADRWVDCAQLGDAELAARIRADRIDLLVDLAGHTANQRLKAFALRPAPVQLTYLGYPNTTGLRALDYRLTDARADPPGESDRYSVERLVRLPRSFLCYRPGPDVHEPEPLPAARTGHVTFGCFNNYQKLSGPFFDAAARILAAVPGAKLLLKAKPLGYRSVAEALRQRFAAAGIDPARLVLRGWEATAVDHLAVYKSVDIALDSFPYNGTTTTCEAMWLGVPVVTLHGERHAGRVGSSLLHATGNEELIAHDAEDYVRIATRLAADLPALRRLRGGMRPRMRASPLMDEAGFVQELERCYVELWQARLAALAPGRAPASSTLARIEELRAGGKREEAKAACREILQQRPDDAQALAQLWELCNEISDPGTAIEWLGRAIAADARVARFHYMLGCSLQDLDRTHEAIAAYRTALELDPAFARAANNLGAVLEIAGDGEQAAELYARAARADPALAQPVYNLGNLHRQSGRHAEALECIGRALELDPGQAEWQCSRGELLLLSWRPDEALASFRAAAGIAPADARAHFGLGNALTMQGKTLEAEVELRRALELEPGFAQAHSNLLLCLHYRKGDDASALYKEHLGWAQRHARAVPPALAAARERSAARRLNIGYVSPNFHRHSVASFIEPLLASHDRAAYRIFAYSNAAHADEVTERLKGLCDAWRDIRGLSDDEAARRIREDGIDILVDLAGHTGGGRLLLFARKPAPLQVSWLGYPDTTGLTQIDFRLTDAHADPAGEADRYYSEKLVRLPGGFLCYAPPAESPPVAPAPVLASGRVTFGCFNNLAKITPDMATLWSRLLAACPHSRLLLKAQGLGSESARRELAAQLGADRIELLGPEPTLAAHLARYGEIDIALDTYPYNGATTTCEALWMGVPVVTLAGGTHAARVGASLLRGVGLAELVARTAQEYVDKAGALAADVSRLSAVRAGMRERLRASPLLDARRFAAAVEGAYRDMWAGWCAPLRLHVGGKEARAGWKILNVQPGPAVDYVGDCTDLGRFADESVDEIYASHVLEHLPYLRELPRALAEFRRVLKPGGRAMVSVPDFEVLCRLFLDPGAGKAERIHVMRVAFGYQFDDFDFHHVGLTYEFLAEFLHNAGFAEVEKVDRFGLFEDASGLSVRGTPISLNVVAYK